MRFFVIDHTTKLRMKDLLKKSFLEQVLHPQLSGMVNDKKNAFGEEKQK